MLSLKLIQQALTDVSSLPSVAISEKFHWILQSATLRSFPKSFLTGYQLNIETANKLEMVGITHI